MKPIDKNHTSESSKQPLYGDFTTVRDTIWYNESMDQFTQCIHDNKELKTTAFIHRCFTSSALTGKDLALLNASVVTHRKGGAVAILLDTSRRAP